MFFGNKDSEIDFQSSKSVQKVTLQRYEAQKSNKVQPILKIHKSLEDSRLLKFKEKSEKSRLKIERFRKIQNEIFERQKRVKFIKNLVFRQHKNIDKNIFSIQTPQKKYLYRQKKREAQKQMLEKIQGEYYEK